MIKLRIVLECEVRPEDMTAPEKVAKRLLKKAAAAKVEMEGALANSGEIFAATKRHDFDTGKFKPYRDYFGSWEMVEFPSAKDVSEFYAAIEAARKLD